MGHGNWYTFAMRRAISAAVLVASTLGMFVVPAGADPTGANKVSLSYDFSDNNDPASLSNGAFNISIDVLPEHTPGVVRMVAVAPSDSNVSNMVCRFQVVSKSTVECAFNFTAPGTWAIHAQYAPNRVSEVVATAVTNISVGS